MRRVQLARRVAAQRARQVPWAQIAVNEHQAERTLKHLYRDYIASPDVSDDGIGAVRETLEVFTEAMRELSAVASDADNDNAKVGAIRTLLSAAQGRLELLAALGRLPRQLGALEAQRDLALTVNEIVRVLERHDLGDEIIRELLAVMDTLTVNGRARQAQP